MTTAVDERALYRKVARRLIPLLFFCYILAYLDRVNVGFAKHQMSLDLGLSETVYGTAAGIFFIGYLIFEVPSNLILARVGAKAWIGRIMISWGLVAILQLIVSGPASFFVKEEPKLLEYLRYKGGVHTWVIWVFGGLPVIGILAAILIPMFARH